MTPHKKPSIGICGQGPYIKPMPKDSKKFNVHDPQRGNPRICDENTIENFIQKEFDFYSNKCATEADQFWNFVTITR